MIREDRRTDILGGVDGMNVTPARKLTESAEAWHLGDNTARLKKLLKKHGLLKRSNSEPEDIGKASWNAYYDVISKGK